MVGSGGPVPNKPLANIKGFGGRCGLGSVLSTVWGQIPGRDYESRKRSPQKRGPHWTPQSMCVSTIRG